MDIKMLPIYFVIGGAIVSAATYFGSQAKGVLAAFIAFLPAISVVIVCSIYFASGTQAAVSYAKGMLMLLPPWVLYVLAIIFLLPRIGLAASLIVGVAAYLGIAFLVMRLT
jgi:hypothetical protein